jgi:hypothetical protein
VDLCEKMSYKKALEIEPASRRTGLVNRHLLKKKDFLSEDRGARSVCLFRMRSLTLLLVAVGADELQDEMSFMLNLEGDPNAQITSQEIEKDAQQMVTDFQLAKIDTLKGHPEAAAELTALGQTLGRELKGAKCIFLNEVFFGDNDTAKSDALNGRYANHFRGGYEEPFAATFTQSAGYCALTYCPGTISMSHRTVLPKTYAEASGLCASLGLHLCSPDELSLQLDHTRERAICTGCGCTSGLTSDMRRWTNTSGFPLCPDGEVIVGRGQCLAPNETLTQDTRCCTELPEVYEPGLNSRFGHGEFSISRYVWQDRTARGYHFTPETLNHHMALQALLASGEVLGEERRLIGASSTARRWTFNGSHIANDFSREAVLTNITGVTNSDTLGDTALNGSHIAHDFSMEAELEAALYSPNVTSVNNGDTLGQTSRRLRGTASVSTWLAGAIESTQQAFLQLWA